MLFGDVTTLLPYVANLKYDASAAKSTKDTGKIGGMYFSHGNLEYLFELDYAKTDITYKNRALSHLLQDDITLAYSVYRKNYFMKLGLHHINTTDRDLGNGNTLILTFGENKWKGYDKYTYLLETYYSTYKNGYNDLNISKSIGLLQVSPGFTYSKAININTRNIVHMKVNWVHTNDYTKKNYYSYEIQNTLYYKRFFVNAKLYGGQMISGVKDGGNTVFNTKDILKSGYGIKLGYYITPSMVLSAGYDRNNYREYQSIQDGSFNVASLTFSYTF
jgi:hypothetical protein